MTPTIKAQWNTNKRRWFNGLHTSQVFLSLTRLAIICFAAIGNNKSIRITSICSGCVFSCRISPGNLQNFLALVTMPNILFTFLWWLPSMPKQASSTYGAEYTRILRTRPGSRPVSFTNLTHLTCSTKFSTLIPDPVVIISQRQRPVPALCPGQAGR